MMISKFKRETDINIKEYKNQPVHTKNIKVCWKLYTNLECRPERNYIFTRKLSFAFYEGALVEKFKKPNKICQTLTLKAL